MLRTSVPTMRARGGPGLSTPFRISTRTTTTTLRSTTPKRTYTRTSRPSTTTKAFTLPSHTAAFTGASRPSSSSILQRLRALRFLHSSRARRNGTGGSKPPSPDPTPHLGSPGGAAALEPESQSLGAKMRRLTREYGWSVVGVYFVLSAIDFPFCYLLVRYLGTDRIGEWEDIVVSNVKRFIPDSVKESWHNWRNAVKDTEREMMGNDTVSEHVEMAGWGVEEADARNKTEASLATQLALAYAIHKSFIFIRVPLTAAITPRVVKRLRGWGWDIGKRTTKEEKAAKRAAMPIKKPRARLRFSRRSRAGR